MLSDFATPEAETLSRTLEAGAALVAETFLTEPETLLPRWGKKTQVEPKL
ncbi:MAG: hypothetical protein FWD91_02975 [Treponema sp.]|nr:hypothetical protein [Treponema sp.]